MTDRELMQQALDALEAWNARGRLRIIEALRKRLSQCDRCGKVNPAEIHTCTPLDPLLEALRVPEKREWVGLTHADIVEMDEDALFDSHPITIARAIEAKLKEKNT